MLAHELTHVLQQGAGQGRVGEPRPLQRAGLGEVRVSEGLHDEGSVAGMHSDPAWHMLWFDFDSTDLRRDAQVDSISGYAQVLAAVQAHAQAVGVEQRVTIRGYASEEGDASHNLDLSGDRAIRIKEMLIQDGIDPRAITVEARGTSAEESELALNRRVDILLEPASHHIAFPVEEYAGAACRCNTGAQGPLADWALEYVSEFAPTIELVAQQRGIPPLALAGAIAEEYSSKEGIHAVIDTAQDLILPWVPEIAIDFARLPDFHNKLQNWIQHDISLANIKVRTALEQVEAGRLHVSGSPKENPQVNLIIEYMLTNEGMIDTAGAVIQQGQELFGPYIASYDAGTQEAVLIDFYNIGYETYYVGTVEDGQHKGFLPKLAANPLHRPCPDPVGDGCQTLQNRDALEAAYEAGFKR